MGVVISDRDMVDSVDEIKEAITIFFNLKFTEPGPTTPILEDFYFRTLGQIEVMYLEASFSVEEIKEAVWNCDGIKSPSPNGYNFVFIKKCENILKEYIFNFVKGLHSKAILSKAITSSFLTFIPKIPQPFNLEDYRHICLIG